MSEERPKVAEAETPGAENGGGTAMEEIRQLLLSPEQEQIRRLEEREQDPEFNAEVVSRVLPEAVAIRSGRDRELTASLLPTVEEAIALSVKRKPEVLAEAIFPLMGPAIRRAITATLTAMLASLNQTLENSLSPRSIGWRLEAWRTGKPFAEIVMLRTLQYRVEQVFLIHRPDGLLLQHVSATTLAAPGADLISAMLTAIQDFVHDSFSAGRNEEMDALAVGDLKVWIERGPKAVLAAVIRGEPPADLRQLLQETIETVHGQFAEQLDAFQGNAAPFEASRELLEGCLTFRTQEGKPDSGSLRAISLAVGAVALVAAALSVFPLLAWHRWRNYVDDLKRQPGIIVTESDRYGGKFHVTGLRDPLAANPAELLARSHVNPESVVERWEPYASSYPDYVLARARELLAPPSGVSMSAQNGVLSVSGSAPEQWIETARKQSKFVGGINQFDDSHLAAAESFTLEQAIRNLESESLQFRTNSAELTPSETQRLPGIAREIQNLLATARQANRAAHITVEGYADSYGNVESNQLLSQTRADQVLSSLPLGEGDRANLSSRGMGSSAEGGDSGAGRRGPGRNVRFRVGFRDK